MKRSNLHIIVVPKKEERKNVAEVMFQETMAENFPKLRKDMTSQVQKTPKDELKKKNQQHTHTHRYIIKKTAENQKKTLKAARGGRKDT